MNKEKINDIVDEYKEFAKIGKEKDWPVPPDTAIALMNILTKRSMARSIADAINNLADAIRYK